jgi:hypothetical protein
MGMREKINDNPKLGFGVAAAMVIVASGFAAVYLRPVHHQDQKSAFFTDDDGQTYFKESIFKFPPWDHDGKTAVEASVYTDGQNTFVGLETRFTPEAKKQLEDRYAQDGDNVMRLMISPQIMVGGSECKLPGAQNHWLPASQMQNPPLKKDSDGLPPDQVFP